MQRRTLPNQKLDHFSEQKDLGVIKAAYLKFHEYICTKIKKENTVAGLNRRSF